MSNSVTALDVQNYFVGRLTKTKNLNAFITETTTLGLDQATCSHSRYSSGQSLSALDGIPVAIKDNFCTKDVRTTCASKMLENFIPGYNSSVYQRLTDRGCTLMGKTNMDEFGMGSGTIDSIFGPTKNPWSKSLDDWNITGGSSGGSAAAVAAGSVAVGIGSDTGGSVRNPASYCGVVGFKPSYGLVSRHGLIPLVNSMDVPGILTRTVEDCVEVFNAISGPDDLDSTTVKRPATKILLNSNIDHSLEGLRVGIPLEYHCEGLDSEILELWKVLASELTNTGGASVQQVSMPNTKSSIFVYSILNQCEVSSNMSRYDGLEFGYRETAVGGAQKSTEELYELSRANSLNRVVKSRILSGNYFLLRKNYDKYFEKALKVRRLIANDFVRVFEKCDLLLTPTTLTTAPQFSSFNSMSNRDQSAIQDFFTQPANMAGVPAITVPVKLSKAGLPLSLQLMGPHSSEQRLFEVARWIEKAVQFKHLED